MTKIFISHDKQIVFTLDLSTDVKVLEENILNWCLNLSEHDQIHNLEMWEGGSVSIQECTNRHTGEVIQDEHIITLSGDNGVIELDELKINSNF